MRLYRRLRGNIPRVPFFPSVKARWVGTLTPAGTPGIEIEPRRSTETIFTLTIEVKDQSGDPVTVYLSTRAMITADDDTVPATTFRELVNDPGTVKRQVSSGRTAGFVAPTWGGAEFNNTEGQFDAWLEYVTDGGKVTCRYGPLGGAYPEEYRTVYIAYIDGYPQFDARTMRLSYRGRERAFDSKVVTDAFVPTVTNMYNGVDLGGTGVAGSRLKYLVIGTPGYIEPILIDATNNLWFIQANRLQGGVIQVFDGGIELTYSGIVGGTYPGRFGYVESPYGPVYAQFGSPIRFAARQYTTGVYNSPTESARRWNIVDLAKRAGITDADPGTMPTGSVAFDAGNRVVETQSYKDVFNDIAAFEVASIGFNRLDQFYARRIVPSWLNSASYTFTEGQNSRKWSIAPISGLERRAWKVTVKAGETHKSALAGAAPAAIRDAMSRDPWMTQFTATAQSVYDLDESAEAAEVEIVGNEFTTRTIMEDWALRYLRVFGSHMFAVSIEVPLNIETMALELLDTVSIVSDRYGCVAGRNAVVWSIEMNLKQRTIRLGLLSHRSDSPDSGDIAIEAVDDTVGAGGNGSGSGATGSEAATLQNESFVIACSDETTALTTGTSKRSFFVPYALKLVEVQAALTTPQTSGSIFTVDINEAGATILSTKLTIDNGEATSVTAATPPVISDTALAKGAKVTVDIDQIGDGTAKGLSVTLIGYQV